MEPIGRDAELALVADRIRTRRLVTLVGPGGIGKTTLARRVAERVVGDFDEGVLTVDLTLVDTPDGVRESFASQLGYSSFRDMLDAPGDRSVLIVMDNCEHVLDAVAEAVSEALASCEMPTVLATSRMALELPGEAIVPVGPLELPPRGLARGPAVDLFVERARDAGGDIGPSESVAELCRRLDGVPLAIELAAARTRSMTPEEILGHLDAGLHVLDRPRRRSAARHQSLRAAIGWSYDLLGEEEQVLFSRLSVFAGPFTAPAAHAVAGVPGSEPSRTLGLLDDLVAASMVVADTDGPTTRFRLLETIRSHGRAALDERGERLGIEERLVDHTVERATRVLEEGSSSWSSSVLADLLDLYGDHSAAVRWCLQHDDEPDRALLLVAVLWGVVHQAHTEEVGSLAERVVDRWERSDHALVADAVATAATCQYMLGDLEGAIVRAEDALARDPSSPFAPATLRRVVAQARRAGGDADGAIHAFAETADAARHLGLVAMATEADSARAQVLADVGRTDEALQLVRRACAEAAAAGSEVGVAWARAIEGSILLRVDPHAAARLLDEVLVQVRDIRYHAGESVVLRARALADLLTGELADAADRTLELLGVLLASGSATELRAVLDVASPLLREAGGTAAAADLAATALSLPIVSITASVGHELRPLDPAGGSALPIRDAILVVRDELSRIVEPPAAEALGAPGGRERRSRSRRGAFRRAGDVWEVGWDGEEVAVRSTKGMSDLHVLLSRPGREVHCLELVGSAVDESGTGTRLDDTARKAYEDRVRHLQGEIDEADADNDIGRAERARVELDALVDELTSALGLGGRARTSAGSSAERARSTVTQRVRSTIRRIEDLHPRVGRHLRASIRTGTFCSYAPEEPVDWEL